MKDKPKICSNCYFCSPQLECANKSADKFNDKVSPDYSCLDYIDKTFTL